MSLQTAIHDLQIPIDGGALVHVLALRDQLDARIAEAVGAFDSAKLWDIDAATSMTAWLRSSASMTNRAAGRLASLARRMRQLPVCAAAYSDGSLSGGQGDATCDGSPTAVRPNWPTSSITKPSPADLR